MKVYHPNRPPDIPQLIELLAAYDVRYVLTGSVAAHMYGVAIGQAGDFDITPALDAENLHRLGAALEAIAAALDPDGPFGHWDTRQNGEKAWIADDATPELRAQQTHWIADPTTPSTFDHLFRSRLGNFDIVPTLSGTYAALMKRAIAMDAWGYTIWVLHIDELLATLTMPRRAKDVPRVQQLRVIQRQRGELEQSKISDGD